VPSAGPSAKVVSFRVVHSVGDGMVVDVGAVTA
jgi:hypothetical protein